MSDACQPRPSAAASRARQASDNPLQKQTQNNLSGTAFASIRSGMSKPSFDHPQTDVRRSRASPVLPWSCQSRARMVTRRQCKISPITSGPRPIVTAQGRIRGRMPIALPLSAIGRSHPGNPGIISRPAYPHLGVVIRNLSMITHFASYCVLSTGEGGTWAKCRFVSPNSGSLQHRHK